MQNKDIVLADCEQGIHYLWLPARRVTALDTNVDSEYLSAFVLFINWLLQWASTVSDSWRERTDIHFTLA